MPSVVQVLNTNISFIPLNYPLNLGAVVVPVLLMRNVGAPSTYLISHISKLVGPITCITRPLLAVFGKFRHVRTHCCILFFS